MLTWGGGTVDKCDVDKSDIEQSAVDMSDVNIVRVLCCILVMGYLVLRDLQCMRVFAECIPMIAMNTVKLV